MEYENREIMKKGRSPPPKKKLNWWEMQNISVWFVPRLAMPGITVQKHVGLYVVRDVTE
jgi:hypothetical protein